MTEMTAVPEPGPEVDQPGSTEFPDLPSDPDGEDPDDDGANADQ